MAIAQFLLLVVAVIAQHYGTTPPNIRPPTEQLREQGGLEPAIPYLTALARAQVWSWALIEGSILFALSGHCPPVLARPLLHVLLPTSLASDPSTFTTISPAFFAGTVLSITGALLRAHCFHALGSRFTFELSIRPAHALVTDGAYGVVRHPSYTGGAALGAGWLLYLLDRRGWVVGVCAGWLLGQGSGGSGNATVTGVLACVWPTALGMMYVVLNRRMNREDAMLENNFGEEWRAWAKRVPWRLVPGVY